ncbi:MAG: ABC transporter ATP-binding protein [Candidatus Pacebacteria bacterium]|nr:ABC transporter ATP-binding protein [Candidatus Paceibacterota bacterium]
MKKKNEKRIEVKNVSKKFSADFRKREGALFNVINSLSGRSLKKEIEILKDISFDLYSGEILGVIGKNGSGKSTLLRLIAGVYEADSGKIETNGKILYLTGFGQGSAPKLTMRENIYLMGSVMGLGQRDIKKRFNEIIEFSGLKDFVDMKVYQFSTGMISRLNFSVIIHCLKHQNPEILLLDEVLSAGGDFEFQEKATNKMEELIKGGASVILVSHDLNTIKKYCNKTLFLDNGKIVETGDSESVIKTYLNSFNSIK